MDDTHLTVVVYDDRPDEGAALAREILGQDMQNYHYDGKEPANFHIILSEGPVTYADTQRLARVREMWCEEGLSVRYRLVGVYPSLTTPDGTVNVIGASLLDGVPTKNYVFERVLPAPKE